MERMPYLSESAKAAARHWVVRLSDDRTPEARGEFEQWLAQSPSHASAYRNAMQVWGAVGELRHLAELEQPETRSTWLARLSIRRQELIESLTLPFRNSPWAAASVIVAVGLVLVAALHQVGWPARNVGQSTDVAEIRDINLPDGSRITLGPRSRIEVAFTSSERRVTLRDGEAVFNVVHDTKRPFVVLADNVVIRDVGTRFDVHLSTSHVRIAVIEGVVDVTQEDASATAPGIPTPAVRRVRAGEQITSRTQARLGEVQSANLSDFPTWRTGMLRYQDATLDEVVAEANRYYRDEIVLGTPEIGALRVTASFSTSQVKEFIDSLPEALPVHLDRTTAGRVVVLSRKERTSTPSAR